jgi:hypothetical protein
MDLYEVKCKECLSCGILDIILSPLKVLNHSIYERHILRNRNTCKAYATYK